MSDPKTPTRLSTGEFNIASVLASATKPSFNAFNSSSLSLNSLKTNSISALEHDYNKNKIEFLEKERLDLSLQVHQRDEKNRENKLLIEKLEFRLKASEEERNKAITENAETREKLIRLKYEYNEAKEEINELKNSIKNKTLNEASESWKKITATTRELKRLEEAVSNLEEANKKLEDDKKILMEEKESVINDNNILLNQLNQLKERLNQLESYNLTLLNEKNEMEERIEINNLKYETEKFQLNEEKMELIKKYDDTLSEYEAYKYEIEKNKQNFLTQATNSSSTSMMDIEDNENFSLIIADLKKKLYESEEKRRSLHNIVQDLRGNIRVFVRCRPFLSCDQNETEETPLILHDDQSSLSILPHTGSKPLTFSFDKIFDSKATQENVFSDLSDLIQSAMDGYKVCIFTYGQTGSGKTHTMTGADTGPERGLVPRSIEGLLSRAYSMIEEGWKVSLSLSCLELYNEDIRDLMLPRSSSSFNSNSNEKIKIYFQNNRVTFTGLTQVPIPLTDSTPSASLSHTLSLLAQARQARTTAATGMNETSSRSHFLVMIDINAELRVSSGDSIPSSAYKFPSMTPTVSSNSTNSNKVINLSGGLRLVDLAGSERQDKSNASNDANRLREATHINKSLSALGEVFMALQQNKGANGKSRHVPYRNSKLTMLLQDCLSGQGKSILLVALSPCLSSKNETICTLKFAQQVKQIELGKASKNISTVSIPTVAVSNTISTSFTSTTAAGSMSATINSSSALSNHPSKYSSRTSSVYSNNSLPEISDMDCFLDELDYPQSVPSSAPPLQTTRKHSTEYMSMSRSNDPQRRNSLIPSSAPTRRQSYIPQATSNINDETNNVKNISSFLPSSTHTTSSASRRMSIGGSTSTWRQNSTTNIVIKGKENDISTSSQIAGNKRDFSSVSDATYLTTKKRRESISSTITEKKSLTWR